MVHDTWKLVEHKTNIEKMYAELIVWLEWACGALTSSLCKET